MEKEVKNKSASVRVKLMNIVRTEGIDFDTLKKAIEATFQRRETPIP